MKLAFDYASQSFTLDLTPSGRFYRATVGDETVEVEIIRAEDARLDLLLDGRRLTAYVSSNGAKRWVTLDGRTFSLTKSSGAERRGAKHDHVGELIAPMPGQVRAVNVAEGDSVTRGQTLMLLEAMKMEIRVQSPRDGVVRSVAVKAGQTVEREQILIIVEDRMSEP
jgi:acetyl-CoA/propionyl-CoA carboxylase biotin carboxyl carrier protein